MLKLIPNFLVKSPQADFTFYFIKIFIVAKETSWIVVPFSFGKQLHLGIDL